MIISELFILIYLLIFIAAMLLEISRLKIEMLILPYFAATVRRFLLHNGIFVFNPGNLKNENFSQPKNIGGYGQDSRFITADPVTDGLNWYAYANNNPLRFVDPTGLYEVYSYIADADQTAKYSLRTKGKGQKVLDTATNTLAAAIMPIGAVLASNFRSTLDKATEALSGYKEKTVFDSSVHKISLDSVFGDAASILSKDNSLSLFSGVAVFNEELENNKTDTRIDSFLPIDQEMLKDISNDNEAIARCEAIAGAANLYYDKDLDEHGVTKEDWSNVLVDISNGVDNGFLNEIEANNEVK